MFVQNLIPEGCFRIHLRKGGNLSLRRVPASRISDIRNSVESNLGPVCNVKKCFVIFETCSAHTLKMYFLVK